MGEQKPPINPHGVIEGPAPEAEEATTKAMTLSQKKQAMDAFLLLIEAERHLKSKVPLVRDDLPQLWAAQVDGVQAERGDPKWKPKNRLTLADLIPMLAPHKGVNQALNYLPPYPDEFRKVIAIRNAIGHGDWEELISLGGADAALAWAACFYRLVQTCENVIASAMLQLKGGWEWPK